VEEGTFAIWNNGIRKERKMAATPREEDEQWHDLF